MVPSPSLSYIMLQLSLISSRPGGRLPVIILPRDAAIMPATPFCH